MAAIAEREVVSAPSPESFRVPVSFPISRPALDKLNSLKQGSFIAAKFVSSEVLPRIVYYAPSIAMGAATYLVTKNEFLAFGILVMSEPLVNAVEDIIGDRLKPHPFQDGVLR